MSRDIPVVFIHNGASWYLPYALCQAATVSPQNKVVLIGDSAAVPGISHVPVGQFSDTAWAKEFLSRYIHMSPNPKEFEQFCFLRWHYLLEYMRMNDVESAFYFDSDVLLYTSVEDIMRIYGPMECGFLVLEQDFDQLGWWASAHMSFWTRKSLEQFCGFILDCFRPGEDLDLLKRKWNWHVQNRAFGGISDMTALYLFWYRHQKEVVNLARPLDGGVFDDNINCSANLHEKEYVRSFWRKKSRFSGGQPMLLRSADRREIRAHALHFQGAAKGYMPEFYRGVDFSGKVVSDRKHRFDYQKKIIKEALKKIIPYRRSQAIPCSENLS